MATRRPLTTADVDDFTRAATERPSATPKARPTNVAELLQHLARRDPLRVRRIHRDMRWLDRKGRKFGIRVW